MEILFLGVALLWQLQNVSDATRQSQFKPTATLICTILYEARRKRETCVGNSVDVLLSFINASLVMTHLCLLAVLGIHIMHCSKQKAVVLVTSEKVIRNGT